MPETFDYYWKPPAPVFDPAKAKKLLADAGFPKGFDAGDYYCDVVYGNLAEAVMNDLAAVGIKAKLRPLERAAFFKGYGEKSFKNLIQGASGAFGNAATRVETFVVKGGVYVYGSYPEIDELFQQQAAEIDLKKREASYTRCSRSCTRRQCTRRFGSRPSSTASGRAWANRLRPHPAVSLHRAVRGHHAQERVTAPGRAIDPQSYRMWQNFRHPDRSRAQRGAVEGPVLLPRRQDEVPRLRRPLGGFARDDGINSHMR